MRHAIKIKRNLPMRVDVCDPLDDSGNLSGSLGGRGSCFRSGIFFAVMAFVLATFLLPGTISAARLATEKPIESLMPEELPQAPEEMEPAAVDIQAPVPTQSSSSVESVDDSTDVEENAAPEEVTQEVPPEEIPPADMERPDVVAPLVESPQLASEPPVIDTGKGRIGASGFSDEVRGRKPPRSPGEQVTVDKLLKKALGGQTALPEKPSQGLPRPPAGAAEGTRYVTIDFDDVDITVFIKFVSELTGRNFLIDNKVKGKVTVISPKKIPVDEVYKVFESVLEIYGFTTVQAGEVTKVIPFHDAHGKQLDLLLDGQKSPPEDRMVTQILTLKQANPNDIKKILDRLISKTSSILAYPPTGMLIITDVLSNIQRLQDIVTALDVPGVGEVISYIPLKFASAQEMVKPLLSMFQRTSGTSMISPVKIVADERTNALIINAAENDTVRVRELIDLMDKDVPKGSGMVRVYYLQNAKAEDLAQVLTGISQQTRTRTTGKAAAAEESIFSKSVKVLADKATNSLVISADPTDYPIIEDVIQKLDITRSMVYLEALIMEMNADKAFNVGVEWSLVKDVNIGYVENMGGKSAAIAGFSGTSAIPQVNASTGAVSFPSGFSLGVVGAGITIGGVLFPNIGAVLNAYQNDTDVRILSTPQLLTLDNEDAEITVGSNVPYVTRQDTSLANATNYSNYEYKDVGVTLKVTPQINRDGYVRMKIDQTVTKVVSSSATVSSDTVVLTPTTLKRTAKTTVVVKSGETVVLGGMIQDDSDKGTSKVPLLGDIPLLGWLFKSRSTTNTRTNLFVFITPRIIQTPEDAVKIKDEKLDYMQVLREGKVMNTPARNRTINATEDKESKRE